MSVETDFKLVLNAQSVHKRFGENHVLHNVTLQVAAGQIVALVGPSGCGKSTLLKIILGILEASDGGVYIGSGFAGRVYKPGADRGIVFQNYGLMPFLTAEENVALGPDVLNTTLFDRLIGSVWPWSKWRRLKKKDLAHAREILSRMGLEHAFCKYPSELSGGMQQRVAIAQAIITRPHILLLDEPFGALDEATRESLQMMLLEFREENLRAIERGEDPPYSIIMVTHELNEAIYVSDRVVGLSQYWNWKEAGFETCPGATIVYDRPAPIFHPDDPKEHEQFVTQRGEIREVVFRDDILPSPNTHVTFWNEVYANGGQGVLTRRKK